MTVIIEDGFSGSNGSSVTGRTPDTTNTPGNTWGNASIVGGAGGGGTIQSNQLQLGTDNFGHQIDAGDADVIVSVDWIPAVGVDNRNSVIVRYSDDNNYWYMQVREPTNDVFLQERNGGTNTTRQSGSKTFNEGTTYALKVELSGNTIDCQIDDVNPFGGTHSSAFNNTATRHGVLRHAGNNATRLDNFVVDDGEVAAPATSRRPGFRLIMRSKG